MRIAYVGRYRGPNDDNNRIQRSAQFNFLHVYNFKKYIKKYNQTSPIPFELVVFDNHKNPDSTRSVYEKILEDSSIVAVIDNSWGAELQGAQTLIQEKGIPVVAINGDMNELDYGPTLFTGNSDNQIGEIVHFLSRGLRADTINFVSELDYKLHNKYLRNFQEYGITIGNELDLPSSTLDKNFLTTESIIKTVDNDYVTVLNTHSDNGSTIMNTVNRLLDDKTIIGHASVLSHNSLHRFNDNNRLIILSQSESAIPKIIAEDISLFKKDHPDLTIKFNSALFFGRCKNAWSIIESCLGQLETPSKDSLAFELKRLHGRSLNLKYDILTFDKGGSLIKENSFVEYRESGENAFSLQLNSQKHLIPNMSFGIEIIDIQNIDLNTNSFAADFYYWITADSSFNEVDEYITFQNIKPSESEIELISEKRFDQLNYKLFKVSGVFLEVYDESKYPFDDQEISVDIQILNTTERLRVSFDKESFNQSIDELSLKGWKQEEFYVTVDNTVTDRLKGNLELTDNDLNKFKNISFRFKVSRSKLPGLLQVILPLFFIGILAIALLFLRQLDFSIIGEPLAAVFLTIIAFSISLSDITPTGNLLTKTDFLFILTLITVVMSFLLGLLHNIKRAISLRVVEVLRVGLALFYIIAFTFITFYNQ